MKHKMLMYITVILVSGLLLLLLPGSARAAETATFNSVTASALPGVQGAGGIIEVTATAEFFGGCCYPLYSSDVAGEILLPPGVEVVQEPAPAIYDKVEVTAGGVPMEVSFTWLVRSWDEGSFDINVNVTTSDCGIQSDNLTLEYIAGVPISLPRAFPLEPHLDEPYRIMVESSSPVEGVVVEWVQMVYVISDSRPATAKTENHTLNGRSGTVIDLTQGEYVPELWNGTLPSTGQGRYLTFWFVAHDSMDRNTTSQAYVKEIIDPSVKSRALTYSMGFMLVSVFMIWGMMHHLWHRPRPLRGPGLLPIGRDGPVTDLAGPINSSHEWEQYRNPARIVILMVALGLILAGAWAGYFSAYWEAVGP